MQTISSPVHDVKLTLNLSQSMIKFRPACKVIRSPRVFAVQGILNQLRLRTYRKWERYENRDVDKRNINACAYIQCDGNGSTG